MMGAWLPVWELCNMKMSASCPFARSPLTHHVTLRLAQFNQKLYLLSLAFVLIVLST